MIHLVWLTTDIVLPRALGTLPLFADTHWFQLLVVFVDYIEIPSPIDMKAVDPGTATTGDRVEVTGMLTPVALLSASTWEKYDIKVSAFKKL